ncbi:autotransporter outer membrane beta-barrel domain-containing protein [Bartonella sp. OC42QHQL]|uniref:autotransporter outer membrane beta-barrel domain-containing protein n=1 Tax=Bartonella sp. OC42QHQL TaxID=3243565 RepID=UPI0035D0446E
MINVVKNRTRLYALTTSVLFFLQGMDVYSSGWWPLPNLPFGLGGLLGGAEARGSTGEEGPGKTAEAGRQSADGQMAAQVSGSDGAQQRQQQANLRGRAQQGTEAEGTVLQSLASLSSYDCTLQDNERQHNPIYCYDGEAHKVKGSAIGVKKFGENAVYAVGNKGVKGSGHSVGHVKVPSVPIAHKATSVAMEDVNITGVTPSQPVADGGASLRGDVQGAGGKYGFGSAVFSRLGAEVTLKKTNTQDFVTGLEAENGGHIVMEGGRIEKSYIGALADNSSSISLEGVDIYLEEPDGKVPLGVNVLQSFSGSTISMKSGSIIFPLGAAGVLSENEGFVKLEEVKINVLRKVAGGGTTEVGSRGAGFGGKDISVVFVLKDGFVSSNRVTFNGSDAIVLWVGNSFVLNDTLFDVLNVYSGNVGDTDGFVETVDAAISDGTGKIGASFKSSRFKVDGKKSYGIYFSEPLLEGALVETKSSGNLLEGLGDERAATQKEAAQLEVKEKDGEVIRHAVILENSTLRVPEGVAIYGGNLKGSVVVGRGSTVSGDVLLKASSRSDLSVFVHSSTIFGPAYVDKDADARFFLSGSEWYLAKSDVQSTYSSLGWNCSYSCISHMGLVNSNVRFVSPSGNDRGYKTLHIGKGRGTVYSAEGVSKIFFNADLMPKSVDDDATQVSDRLLIHGDVSGKTLVHVNSVSNGAVLRQNESQDIPYSVSIIQVFGSAEEDSFKLEHGYITLDGLPYKYVLRAYGPTIPPKMNYFDRKLVANSRDVWDFRLENQYVIPLVSGYTTATNFQPIFKPKPRILVASSAETETGSGTGQGEVNGQSVTPSVSGESASVISVQSSPLARSEDFEESETSGQHSSNERTDVGLSNLAVSSRHGPSGLTLSLVSGVPTSDEERVGNRLVTSADMDIVLLDSMSSVSYGRGEDVEYVISGLDDASETDLSEIGTYETGVYRLESDTLDHTVTDEDGLEETVVMTAVSTLSPPSTSLLSTVSTVSKEKGSISSSPTLPARSETSSAVESPSLPNGSPAAPSVSGEEASVLLSSSPTLPARSETSSAVESPSLPNGSPAAPSVSGEEASVLLSSSPTLPARSETSSAVESPSLPNGSPAAPSVSGEEASVLLSSSPTLPARSETSSAVESPSLPNGSPAAPSVSGEEASVLLSSSPTLPARSETSSAVESPSLPNGSPAAPSVSGEEASVLLSSSPTLPARSETSSAVESPSLPNGSPAAPSVSGEEASVLLSSSPTLPARSETSSAVESPSLPNGSPAAPSVSREEASVLLSSSPTLPARSETSSAVESLSLPNRSPVTFPVSRKPVPLNSYAAIVPPLSSTKPKVSGSVDRVGSANNEDASSQCNDTEQNGVGRSQIAYSCSDGQSHTMRNLTLKASDKKQHSMHAKRQNTIIELEGATISGADFSFDDKNNVDLTQLQAVSAVLAEEGAEVVLNKKSTVQSSLIGLEAQRGGKVKMTGGAVNVHYVGALAGSGSSVDLSDTKINITGDLAVAALASNAGQITMDSGVITLTNGVAVRSESGGNVTLDRVNIIAKRGQNKPNSTETFGRAAFLLSDRGSVGFANGSVVTDANALWIRNNGDVVESGSSRTKRSSQIRSSVNHANIEYSTIRVEGDESYGIYFDGMDQRSVGAQNHAANGKPTRQTRSVKSSVVSSSEKVPVDITGVVSLKKTDFEVLKSIAIYGNNSSGRVSIEDKAHLSGDLLLRSENSSNLSVSVDNSLITGGARVDRSSHAKFDLSNGAQWLLTKSQHQLQQSANADCSDSCISSINLANSSIKFVLPTSGENQYQTLRIGKGSGTVYSASGASIHLNARLNPHDPSDQQVTDRLVIHGDVSGKTKIHVRGDAGNVGDVIANRKIAHSVSVIQVYGQAKKDSFQLDGNYVALRNSPYKYTLRAYAPEATSKQEHVQQKFMKDGGAFWNFRLENQYVKSMGSAALPEQFARSVVPQVPTYLSLPNSVFHAGLMDISNQKKQFETLRMTSTGMVEVRENPALYLRGYGGSYRYASDLSALEYGYDGDLDYRGVEAGVLLKTIENADNSISFGVMGTYGKLSLQPLNVEQSQKSAFDKWTATVYGSMQHNVGFYVDSLLSYGLFKGDVLTRARGKTATLKGNPLSVSLSGGQTIVTGYEGFVFDPQVQVVYQNLQFNKARDIDNFDIEMGRLDQWVARVGGRLIKTPTGPEGVNAVAFYGKLYLAHGFEGKQSVHFKDAFKLGAFGSSLEAGLGFNAKLLPQFSLHADVLYQHKLNKAGFSGTSFSGGVRYQF